MSNPLSNMDHRRNEAIKMLEEYNDKRNECKIYRAQAGQAFSSAPNGERYREIRRKLERAEEELAAHTEVILGLMGVDS